MRNLCFCLLLMGMLVFPAGASARQNKPADGKKAHKQSDIRNIDTTPKEVDNWKVLDDIKTGLHPGPFLAVQKDEEPEFVRELVRVQWRAGDPIDLWIMRPKTQGKVPVVLYLYSFPTEGDQFRDDGWAKRATADGFAAVGFVSALTGQRYHMRPLKQWFVSELTESLGSSVHDVQLILNYLTFRGDMNMNHVGMIGMGSGASIAILAAQADPRIKVLDLFDPWGDWPDWLRESPAVPDEQRPRYTTEEFLNSVATLDPVAYLPSLRSAHIRLQQTLTDPVTPKSAQERIATSLTDPRLLVRYANSELLLKAWQADGLSGWIKQRLRAEIQNDRQNPGLAARDSSSPRN
jgi:cephalosporin-C deacetylase-like acetyl esterase